MLINEYAFWLLPTLTAFLAICVWGRKLTLGASIIAGILGLLVLEGAGLIGAFMLLTFFSLSVLATSHKKSLKLLIHPEPMAGDGRTAAQVFANGGVAGILSLLAIVYPSYANLFILMLAASLASALADTLSSEIGMVYGRRYFNIITFKREANGLDGVISIEGTLIGLGGAFIIALIFSRAFETVLLITFAGFMGNIVDSVLGALLERRQYLSNNAVNFLNTLSSALLALLVHCAIGS